MKRRRIILVLAALLAAGLVVVGVLLKTAPDVYRRTAAMGADAKAIDEFDTEVINRVGNVYLDKSRQTPLELHLTEEAVNARLVQSMADLEAMGRSVPPALHGVRVAFEPGEVVLTTRLGSGATSVVVTQAVRLEIGPEGRLHVEPGGTSVGLVRMPVDVLGQARPVVDHEVERLQQANDDTGTLEVMRAIQQAFSGEAVPLGKGKKRIVLDEITVGRGYLKIVGHQAGRVEKPAAPKEGEPPPDPKE